MRRSPCMLDRERREIVEQALALRELRDQHHADECVAERQETGEHQRGRARHGPDCFRETIGSDDDAGSGGNDDAPGQERLIRHRQVILGFWWRLFDSDTRSVRRCLPQARGGSCRDFSLFVLRHGSGDCRSAFRLQSKRLGPGSVPARPKAHRMPDARAEIAFLTMRDSDSTE